MFGKFLDILFPPHCLKCGSGVGHGETVCGPCLSTVKLFENLFCGQCRARLPEGRKICHHDFPYLLGAAADYRDETVRALIHGLKFKFVKTAARPLGSLLVAYAEHLPQFRPESAGGDFLNFTVVPIPLGPRRERSRGFNQSFLIAKIFSDRFGMRLDRDILLRARDTRAQSELDDFGMKRENMKGCFLVGKPDAAKNGNFILIDDVTTSGATFFEAANALKRAGAKKIIALAAARS